MLSVVKILSLAALAGVALSAPASGSDGAGASSASATATGSGQSSSGSTSVSSSSSGAHASSSSSGRDNSTSSSGGGSGGGVSITVKNSCSDGLKINKLDNGGGGSGSGSAQVGAGSSHDFQVDGNWQGRIWGCENGGNCDNYGSAVSLAEFTFKGYGGEDFYDVSFVDGFNLPISIAPEGGQGECKSPTCASLPSCPNQLKSEYGACKSACAAFNNDEYCCRGEYNSAEKCKASQYADVFKKGCPDAYSYAYDDKTSTFGCKAYKYTVTLCPNGGSNGSKGSSSN